MENIFIQLLNMSISAGWLVLAVVLLRFVLKNAPKVIRCVLWGIVGIRLVCPVFAESVLSLIPSGTTIPEEIVYAQEPTIYSGIPFLNSVVNPVLGESFTPQVENSVNPLQIVAFVASILWAVGVVAMLVYAVVSYFSIHTKVREAVLVKENIYICDVIGTPFILGVIKPRIFLPSSMKESDIGYVIAHEKSHIKRFDHIWKPLGFLILSVYWFNPLMWLAYILLCRDIELACDEKVISKMECDDKKSYSEALINCSIPRRMIAACPLAFGEVGVKTRIKSVLNYKKPAFWLIVVAVVSCIVVAVCFLTNPENIAADENAFVNYETDALSVSNHQKTVVTIYCPPDEDAIQVGEVEGEKLGDLFEKSLWKSRKAPRENPPSPGSIEFVLLEDYRVTLYQKQKLVSVKDGDEKRWYTLKNGDYDTALAMLKSPSDVTMPQIGNVQMTLDDVRELSKKGYDLTWADLDFGEYYYTEIGSGLYIRRYVLDEMFTLIVGGGHKDNDIMYARLCANNVFVGVVENLAFVDIRDGDIEGFIRNNANYTPVDTSIKSSWQSCFVGYHEDTFQKMHDLGGTSERFIYSSVLPIPSLPLVKITSTAELDSFKSAMAGYMNFDLEKNGLPSFSEIAKAYDSAFFEENTLTVVYTSNPGVYQNISVNAYGSTGDTVELWMQLTPITGIPLESDIELVLVSIPNKYLNGIPGFEPSISATQYRARTDLSVENNPEAEIIIPSFSAFFVKYSEEARSKLFGESGIPEESVYGSPDGHQVAKIESKTELDDFFSEIFADVRQYVPSSEMPSFYNVKSNLKEYNSAFFEENTVIAVYTPLIENSRIVDIVATLSDGTLLIDVQHEQPDGTGEYMGAEFEFVVIPNSDMSDVTEIGAQFYVVSGSDSNRLTSVPKNNPVNGAQMTLDDVRAFAQKGNDLSWKDLDESGCAYTDFSEEPYFSRSYKIDDLFTLTVSGTADGIVYTHFSASEGLNGSIDIRNADVEKFIEACQNPSAAEIIKPLFKAFYIWYSDEDVQNLFREDRVSAFSADASYTRKIESKAELDAFISEVNADVKTYVKSSELASFYNIRTNLKEYNNAFFEENTVVAIYTPCCDNSKINRIYAELNGGELTVYVEHEPPRLEVDGLGAKYIFVDIPNIYMDGITTVTSQLYTVSPAEITAQYVFTASEEPNAVKPRVTLYNDNTFFFTFSAYSSFIGIGNYKIESDGAGHEKLTLKTDDFDLTYVFDITENAIIFDAASSSDQLWFSDICDGAVFELVE